MPWLVTLLLPLYDNDGARFRREMFAAVRGELLDRFGGVTAHLQTPAEGMWEDDDGRRRRDEVITIEVMTAALDRQWWQGYRQQLEQRFHQDAVLVRASAVDLL